MAAFDEHLDDVNDLFKEGVGKYNTPGEKVFIDATNDPHRFSIR